MGAPVIEVSRTGVETYFGAGDLEDEILSPSNLRCWAERFAARANHSDVNLILRGVGRGGERLLGGLSSIGSVCAEIAARQTDYRGRHVVLVFTVALSPVGLDRLAAQCRAQGASAVEAWGCTTAFSECRTQLIDAIRLIEHAEALSAAANRRELSIAS
ncbi:MAG: hypothetical protein U5O16_36245 [Rhodococcus sp. (in: high G+C Gram-positive bacteria)]|uniref:hypothetical protein n=1 Tax=Rhodococcus sp. TaxID=1831 RepID=UPI002AD6A2F9|nr:hypothetical protein [Rhodococcus sp. (in: high G+C Gram-positive bacteria)]